jgi:CobQ-like glutamine amidotransferase family enzyme
MIGNYKFRCGQESGGSLVVGFENHSGMTRLGSSVKPLGTVLAGYGNNGEDGTEGVRYQNVFGTYSHGPLLPKNPELCDHILLTALQRKYGRAELSPLDDAAEIAAHDEVAARI